MTQIRIKRVYEEPNATDGYRVLVDRLWPRGIKKEHLKYDVWEKDITPSPELRKWFHEDKRNTGRGLQPCIARNWKIRKPPLGSLTP